MYLRNLHVKNFRCIKEASIEFNDGLNVIIGSNNSGKTAILDILRLALGLGNYQKTIYVSEDDFFIDEFGEKKNEIEIDLIFSSLVEEEIGIFHEMLKISKDKSDLELHIRYRVENRNGIIKVRQKYWGGEKEGNSIPTEVMELFYLVYLEALRDAEKNLRPNRGNRLSHLFMKLAPEIGNQEEYAGQLNRNIKSNEEWGRLIEDAKERINEHLENTTMKSHNLKIDIDFVPLNFRKITEGLKLFIPMLRKIKRENLGELIKEEGWKKYFENPDAKEVILMENFEEILESETNATLREKIKNLERHIQNFEIYQNGLGYNNLIYIATVLGDLIERKNRKSENYLGLLIEEPEAHLHPQLQNVLFDYFKIIKNKGIQVFITSHSPTITAKTNIDTVIVMTNYNTKIELLPIKDIKFEKIKDKKYLQRFLDVTKSQLFFANGVLFVEGISETILIHIFSDIIGENLDKNGIEVVNIGGVAFQPFAELFRTSSENNCMKIRSAIISDDDRKNGVVSDRANKLIGFQSEKLKVFLAERTFEYELFRENEILLLRLYKELHPQFNPGGTSEQKWIELMDRLKSNKDKGEFSQLLAIELEDNTEERQKFKVPIYIEKSINWVIYGKN